jgi:hypothetical protein
VIRKFSRPRRALSLAVLTVAAAAVALTGGASSRAAVSSHRAASHFNVFGAVNVPWAHEEDNNFDSPDPTAAGLCRSSLFDTTNPYPATTNVDLINGDVLNNSGFSSYGCITAQNETTVAVNPKNPKNVVAGTNDYRVCCDFTGLNDGTGWAYYSKDGGATWTNVQLPGLTAETGGTGNFATVDSAGDPALAFGPDGTLYYANIVFSRISDASGIAVSVSKDGGATWGAPTMVQYDNTNLFFNDKEWIAAGREGVAVTWTRFTYDSQGNYLGSPIVMSVSRDRGQTWGSANLPVSDPTRPYNQGSMPVFDSDGTLYVAYEGSTPESGYQFDGTIVARSTNMGQSFTQTTLGRVYDDLDCYPTYGGRQTLSGEQFRLNSFPSISVDPTTDRVAVVWADNKGAGSCGTGAASFTGTTDAHVQLVTSNNGRKYTAPKAIAGGDTVFPSVAANKGKIAVSYYTRAYSPSRLQCTAVTGNVPGVPPIDGGVPVCLDYAARSSSNGFATETRLTTESSNPYIMFANGSFIGDYSQIALGKDGWAHPVWTDFRGDPNSGGTTANQDAYTQAFRP